MTAEPSQLEVLWAMTAHLVPLSLMSIGGGPLLLLADMQRYMVDQQGWLTSEEFIVSYTLGQVAPGPNVLFALLFGWKVAGIPGSLVALLCMVVPTGMVALAAIYVSSSTWARRYARLGSAIRVGLAPLSGGLLMSVGWVLASTVNTDWRGALITALTVLICVFSKINPVWLIAVGAGIGLIGWV